MAEGNNTGTGGINIDGKVYAYDVGTPDDQGGSQGNWSSGDVRVDKTQKDLSKPTRETFAKYLSNATLGKAEAPAPYRPNAYPVGAGDATQLRETFLRDGLGNPTKPAATANEKSFAADFSSTMGAPPPLQMSRGTVVADKGAVGPDGNNLLKNAAVPADPDPKAGYVKNAKGLTEPVGSYVSAVLKNNRFNPAGGNIGFIPGYLQAAAPSDLPSDVLETNTAFANPDKLRFGVSPGNDDSLKREYGFKQLSRIGPALQMAATTGRSPTDSSTSSPQNKPSQAQGGSASVFDTSLPLERVNVENIVRGLIEPGGEQTQTLSFGTKFESTLNNVVDRFSGLSSGAQIALATALVKVAFSAFEQVAAGRIDSSVKSTGLGRYKSSGRPAIGTYSGTLNAMQKLGINPVSRSYKEAVMRGMNSFFAGLVPAQDDPQLMSDTAVRPIVQASYPTLLARSVIRAVSQMTLAMNFISESFKNSGYSSDSRAKEEEILNFMSKSRIVGIFNFFSQIGDVGLAVDGSTANDVSLQGDNVSDAGRKISSIDAAADGPGPAAYGKSRLYHGKVRKLAWAVNQLPDLVMKPNDNVLTTKEALGGPSMVVPSNNDPTNVTRMEMMATVENLGTRLPQEKVDKIEKTFDAEYMPFYFHDLRTNEVLGFHAFLMSLSEDFSANYESTDGFGRIEPVKSYKSTQRKIGFSFVVAALDAKDFDAMWYKINKLTMLMYPQYTAGKKINVGEDFSFTKPFTQAIGASPMIRLRLGNLFRSNYSRFNLANVFGLNEPDVTLFKTPRSIDAYIAKLKKDHEDKIAAITAQFNAAKGKLDKAKEETPSLYNSEYEYLIGNGNYNHLVKSAPPEPGVVNQDTSP
jgi:hypothetical protein